MTNFDKQLCDAFSSAFNEVHVPEDLKVRTLAAIEAKRMEESRTEGDFEERDATLPKESVDAEDRNNSEKTTRPELVLPLSKKRFRIFSSLRAKIALAACAVLLALGIGGGAYAYITPTAYVGIDVNPSIELGINCFDYVVSAEGLNEDGIAVLNEKELTNMRYEDAMRTLDEALANDGYLSANSAVAVTVMCGDEARCAHIESAAKQCFTSAEQGVHCSRASSDEHHAAHEVGMGMGKYQVWKELANAGVDISQEEAANMTMAELRDLAAQNGIDLYGAGSTLSDSSTSQHRLSSKHNEYQHHGDSNE